MAPATTCLRSPLPTPHAPPPTAAPSDGVVIDVAAYEAYDGDAPLDELEVQAAFGKVIAVGELATEWRDRHALVPRLFPCGACEPCRRGGVFVCATRQRLQDFAKGAPRQLAVPARWLTPLPESAAPAPTLAHLGGDALLAYTMYAHANVGPRDLCVVLGAKEDALTAWLAKILASKGAHVVTTPGSEATPLAAEIAEAAAAADATTHPWRLFATTADLVGLATELANPYAAIVATTERRVGAAEPTARAAAATMPLRFAQQKALTLAWIGDGHPDLLPDVLGLALAEHLIPVPS